MIKNNWILIPILTSLTFLAVYQSVDSQMWNTLEVFSHALGASALVLMATSCILAARLPGLEKLLGGMDRVYKQHKWLGITALLYVAFHQHATAKFDRVSPWVNAPTYRTWHLPGGNFWPENFESLAVVGLVLIIVTALNRNIRYSLWRWIHKFSGLIMLFAAGHVLTTTSLFPYKSPAATLLTVFVGLGSVAFIYRLFFYNWVNRGRLYQVSSVERFPRGIALEMKPTRKAISYEPGSFVFLSFEKKGMKDPHPFSIATAPQEDGTLSFIIRSEGNFTRKLRKQIEVGDSLRVRGPYGKFHRSDKGASELWVAGGVGIAPFISWLENMKAPPSAPVHLYYSYRDGDSIINCEKLKSLAEAKGVRFTALCSSRGETLNAEHINANAAASGAKNLQAYYCGPEGLYHSLRSLLRKAGIPLSSLKTELFNFR
jgi:predicted ferric reductase